MSPSDLPQLSWFELPASIAQLLIRENDLLIVACNTEAARMYRCSCEELLGSSMLRWSPELTADLLHEALSSPHLASGRRHHRRKDGTTFLAQVAFSVLKKQGDNLLCKHILEVTETSKHEELLRESQERFRAVADYTYDWESWIDCRGQLIWVNPAVERLTGYTVSECHQQLDYPLPMVAVEDRQMFAQLLGSACMGNSGNDVEFRIARKDRALQWFAVSWQSLKDSQGNPNGFRMSMRDIADRKLMEDQLMRQNIHLEELAATRAEQIVKLQQHKLQIEKLASLGVMSASIAHEISNPLAGIKNSFRLFKDREQLTAESTQLLELIDKEFDRIGTLLSQMRQLCRPTISQRTEFDLARLLDDVIQIVEVQNQSICCTIRCVQVPQSLRIVQHEPEIRQIIYNLLINACDAATDKSLIEISVSLSRPGTVEIAVRDYGHGIPPDLLCEIFEPFVTTKQDSGKPGLGLGLSVSQSLAQAMGGVIEVDSAIQNGAQFTLRLPVSTSAVGHNPYALSSLFETGTHR